MTYALLTCFVLSALIAFIQGVISLQRQDEQIRLAQAYAVQQEKLAESSLPYDATASRVFNYLWTAES